MVRPPSNVLVYNYRKKQILEYPVETSMKTRHQSPALRINTTAQDMTRIATPDRVWKLQTASINQ
jgi:hypothetical protein